MFGRADHQGDLYILNLRKYVICHLPTHLIHCHVYHLTKHWPPFPNNENITYHPVDLVHCNIWGLYHVESYGGKWYFFYNHWWLSSFHVDIFTTYKIWSSTSKYDIPSYGEYSIQQENEVVQVI